MAERESYLRMLATGIREPIRKLLNSGAAINNSINLNKAVTTGITMSGAMTTGLALSGACTSGILISGVWGTGYNTGALVIGDDAAGTALALGTTASGFTVKRINVTAACTGSYLFGEYATYATSADMADGFIMGDYQKITVAHKVLEVYGQRGRVSITGAQAGNTSNQFIGVFGGVDVGNVALALADTGGIYGVLGTASIGATGSCDQPMMAGYFDCAPVANIAGVTLAIRARMQYHCDYGVEAFCQTSNATAGMHIRATAAAALPVGLLFTGENVGGQGSIAKAFKFAAATNCGVATNTNTITLTQTSHHIVVDIAGTDYYVPIFDKSTWN